MKSKIINDDFRNYPKLFHGRDSFVISDPPYNQKYHYKDYKDNLKTGDYAAMLWKAFTGYKSVVIGYPEMMMNVMARVMIVDICEESVAWVYNSNTAKQHRLITWWNCRPDMRKIGQPYKNPTDKRIKKRIEEGKTARLYDWWEINQVKNVSKKENPHPCPIPYEIAKRIVLLTTKEGDVIIDPFAGSGTILQAAKDLGRHYIGFEIDKTYFDYMKNYLRL